MSPNKNRTGGVRWRDGAENVKNAQSGIPLFHVSTWMLGRSMAAVCAVISSTEPGHLAEATQTKAIVSFSHRKGFFDFKINK